jgi:hypothetical protein
VNAPSQLSEGSCAGRTGVKRRRDKGNFGRREKDELFGCKIAADRADNWRRDALGWRCHHRAQSLAAWLAARILRFTRLRMEWASRGIGIRPMLRHGREARATMRDRAEGAVIRDREPGKNSDQRGNAARRNGHRLHSSLIVESVRMLKLFLLDP